MRKTRALNAKLKSRAGFSMVIALIFLLLCSMVGVLVLSAASASAGKLSREREYYRQTMALTSAARLLSNEVQRMTFTGKYRRTETVITKITHDADGKPHITTEPPSISFEPMSPALSNAAFLNGLEDKLNALYQSNMPTTGDGTPAAEAEITPGSTEIVFQANEAQKIPEVSGELTIFADYGIQVVLTCEGNSMTLLFPVQYSESLPVSDGEPDEDTSPDGITTKTTKTIFSATITWGAPTVWEGGNVA